LLELPGRHAELSVYATEAYYTGPGSRVRRFSFRTDGFVSARALSQSGELLTKPLTFAGQRLRLNFVTRKDSVLRAEIQDASSGMPVRGFALADCSPLNGDATDGIVQWRRGSDIAELAGRAVRLRFVMQDTDLYALQFGA
jgi:hypothetical protein